MFYQQLDGLSAVRHTAQAIRMFFFIRQSRSAPVPRDSFHSSNLKNSCPRTQERFETDSHRYLRTFAAVTRPTKASRSAVAFPYRRSPLYRVSRPAPKEYHTEVAHR
jgi:hypothetical protein